MLAMKTSPDRLQNRGHEPGKEDYSEQRIEGVDASGGHNGGKDEEYKYKRFELFEDGSHGHHLESTLRPRGWLSGVFDVFRSREGNHNDQKITNTLVDKYGTCRKIVGHGAFSMVHVSHKFDRVNKIELLYAIKTFRRRPSDSLNKYRKRVTSEFCISSALRHQNLIHALDLPEGIDGDLCVVMEFCVGGGLHSLILQSCKLEVIEADCYFKQLILGVEYIVKGIRVC